MKLRKKTLYDTKSSAVRAPKIHTGTIYFLPDNFRRKVGIPFERLKRRWMALFRGEIAVNVSTRQRHNPLKINHGRAPEAKPKFVRIKPFHPPCYAENRRCNEAAQARRKHWSPSFKKITRSSRHYPAHFQYESKYRRKIRHWSPRLIDSRLFGSARRFPAQGLTPGTTMSTIFLPINICGNPIPGK